jgi:hypothetical protein
MTKNSVTSNIIQQFREATTYGCKFISFLYKTKGTGETSIYTINFGIDYKNSVKHDKELLENYVPLDEIEIQAKSEMLESMRQTLEEGVSRSYTLQDVFETLGKGIKMHKETKEIHIYGYVQSKEQIAEPTNPKKPVNSRPLTLTKKAIEKGLNFKRNKFASFVLNPENIAGIKISGGTIQLH